MATKVNQDNPQQAGSAAQGVHVTEGRDLHITEGVGGTWYYHLSQAGTNARALCGKHTMCTAIPMSTWGYRGHLNERWCPECAKLGADALAAAGVVLEEQAPTEANPK